MFVVVVKNFFVICCDVRLTFRKKERGETTEEGKDSCEKRTKK